MSPHSIDLCSWWGIIHKALFPKCAKLAKNCVFQQLALHLRGFLVLVGT